jgi:hypothetical protein
MYDEIWISSDLPQDLLKEYFNYDATILFKNSIHTNNKIIVENEIALYELFDIQPDKLIN